VRLVHNEARVVVPCSLTAHELGNVKAFVDVFCPTR
jgi:hypothetical protein